MRYIDRAKETTTTTGTGSYTVAGAVAGFQAIPTGRLVTYVVKEVSGNSWEVSRGIKTSTTLTRASVLASSNSGSAVSWAAGTKEIGLAPCAYDADRLRLAVARVVVTSAVTLASDCENGDSIDGVTLATGNVILLTQQATASENGLYVVAASGAPARAPELYTGDSASGYLVAVSAGGIGVGSLWVCRSAAGADVVGTDSLTWHEIGQPYPVVSTDPASWSIDRRTAEQFVYKNTSGTVYAGVPVTFSNFREGQTATLVIHNTDSVKDSFDWPTTNVHWSGGTAVAAESYTYLVVRVLYSQAKYLVWVDMAKA